MPNTISAASTPLAIHIDQLSYKYHKADKTSFYIPTWQVKQGEQVFLHGESGSGKTTLLNLLAGVLTTKSGDIALLEQAFSTLSSKKTR